MGNVKYRGRITCKCGCGELNKKKLFKTRVSFKLRYNNILVD